MPRRPSPTVHDRKYFEEWLEFRAEHGDFVWKKTSGKASSGDVAGTYNPKGYIQITVRGVAVLAHRLVWFFERGRWPIDQIDHINGRKDDNRIGNLREATNAQNHCNRPKQANNTSGVKGVYWFKPNRQWKAQICVNGRCIVLGYFHNFDDAVECRKEAEIKYQGDWRHDGPPTIAWGP